LSIHSLLQSYLWRWDIEINFRDQKSLLGVGEAQVRHPRSVQNQPAMAVAAYGLLLLAAAQCNLQALSQPKWRSNPQPKRLSTASLINLLRHELWSASIRPQPFPHFSTQAGLDHNPKKPQPDLHSARATMWDGRPRPSDCRKGLGNWPNSRPALKRRPIIKVSLRDGTSGVPN